MHTYNTMKNIIFHVQKIYLTSTCPRLAPDMLPTCSPLDSLSLVSRQSDLASLHGKISRYAALLFAVLTLSIANIGMALGANYLKGSWDGWELHEFDFHGGSVGDVLLTLEGGQTYEFGMQDGGSYYTLQNQTITASITDWKLYTGQEDNLKIETSETGEYLFRLRWDNGPILSIYYPVIRLKKQSIIYFDARNQTNWQSPEFAARFGWCYYDSGGENTWTIQPKSDAVEDWVYYATVPDNDYIGQVELKRLNPNDYNTVWCTANKAQASSRTSAKQNCLIEESGKEDYCNSWTPAWTTYCPPITSVTLENNGTSIKAGSIGDGTYDNPYIYTGNAIRVRASATSAVDDPNMTMMYSFQDRSPSNENTCNVVSINNTSSINVTVYNTYNETNGESKTSGTLYFRKSIECTITLNPNGGSGGTESVRISTGETAPNEGTYFNITNPERVGFAFRGWYTGDDKELISTTGVLANTMSGYTYNGHWTSVSNVTLYAKWEPVNLALGKTVVAGYEPGNTGEHSDKITDGTNDAWTTYSDQPESVEWFYIDLEDYYTIDSVQAVWGEVYSTDYVIQARQEAPATVADRADDDMWYPLAEETGATASTTKKTVINAPARYLRVHSLSRSGGFLRLHEFRVFGSGYAAEHKSVPTITSATATYNNDGKAYITPVAEDVDGRDITWFRVYNPKTEAWSLESLNGEGKIVVEGFEACVNYTMRIQAMDQAAMLSAESTINVNVPVVTGTNLSATATFTSGNSEGNIQYVKDGDMETPWEVAPGTIAGENEWLTAGFDAMHYISTIHVYWETHAEGNTRPKDYEIQVSYDGTHFARILHYTSKPGDDETYTLNTNARYVRIFVNEHDQYNGMCIREVEIYGSCGEENEKLVMLDAELITAYTTAADIYVSAIHETIAPDELLYHVEYSSTGGDEGSTTIEAAEVTDGVFRLTGLSKNDTYTVTIYAAAGEDIPANRSENYKTLEFTTEGTYSNYYFAADISNWLGVNSGVWTDDMEQWRFLTIDNAPGMYSLEHTVPGSGTCTFILYDRANSTRTDPQDNKLTVTAGGYNFIMTIKDLNTFVSNYHTLYVAGSAVGTAADAMTHALTWTDATHASWQGAVTPGETFKIIFNKPYSSVTTNISSVITPTEVTYSGSYVFAKLVFDLETWEYEWTEADTYYFDGDEGSSWSNINNWLNGSLPDKTKDVVLNASAVVDIPNAKARSVVLADDATLTVAANKSLVVEGTITLENGNPTTASDLIIRSSAEGNGTLVFSNSDNAATVEMYSKASAAYTPWTWQYIGVPFAGAVAKNTYTDGYLYSYSSTGAWQVVHANDVLIPFEGYSVSYPTAGHTYSMAGALAPTATQAIDVAANQYKVIGNSWTAPIYVNAFEDSDFGSIATKTVYLFNTGSDETGEGADASGDRYAAGTYVAIPIHSAPYTSDSLIAPLQGFYIDNSGGATTTLTLDYSRLVRPVGNRNTAAGAMHAPKRVSEADELKPAVVKLWATGSRYDDRLILLEREDFTQTYDAGWDGEKWDEPGDQPMIYTTREDGTADAVSAIPTLDGTPLTFRAGENSEYTLRMEYSNEDAEPLYLYDTQTDIYTRVENDATYTFYTTDKNAHVRFLLTRYRAPQVATGNGERTNGEREKVVKWMDNNRILIFRNGVIYDITGKRVK